MDIDRDTYKKLISEMVFEEDVRESPNNDKNARKREFKKGWERDTISEFTLKKRLTWHNLGYRLKKELGDKNDEEINEIFKIYADLYSEPR